MEEQLLVITTEYDRFDKTKERLDLLCLYNSGKLVVVELKRDESGRSAELQAIKYAAFGSTLLFQEIVKLRQEHLGRQGKPTKLEEVTEELREFVDVEDFNQLDDQPRIILVAKEFRPEVTATVLWLRRFGVDISCIKIEPYKIDEDIIGITSSILIPLPEAEEYIVRSERKENIESSLSRTRQEYIKFFSELKQSFEKRTGISLSEPKPYNYYLIPTGISSVHFEWLFHGRPRSSFGVELHFEKTSNTANIEILSKLAPIASQIEKETGEKVVVQNKWGKNWAMLYIEKQGGEMTPS